MVDTMITFTLLCDKDHEFEGWFKDSAAFEEQRQAGQIECPVCGSHAVQQGLSRPNISSGKMQTSARTEQALRMRESLKALRREIEGTHENVGEKFAEEARKIHYGEKEARGIYGQTSGDEAKELLEEGIAVTPIPWIEDTPEN